MLKTPSSLIVGLVRGIGGFLRNLLTGPDGVSYAPGRIMGLALFVVTQVVVFIIIDMVSRIDPPSAASEWVILLGGLSAWEVAGCTGAIALVMGIAPADAGGRWWDKRASPPPPVSPDDSGVK